MNYYNRLKDLYLIDYKYDSANLFNDNFKFLLKSFGPSLLSIALILTVIPLLPLIMSGNLKAIIDQGIKGASSLLSTPNLIGTPKNILISLLDTIATTLVLSYFIMTYFMKARDMRPAKEKSMAIFRSGLLKLLGIMLIGMVLAMFLSLGLFMLFFLGQAALILYTLGVMLLLIFIQTFQVSIFDDARVKFGLIFERTMGVIKNKGFKFKFIFIIILNLLVPWTMDSIVQLLPDKIMIYGLLIASYLNSLYSLFMLGFLISVFIFYSEHVKYYLSPDEARDYGYDPIKNTELAGDHD